MSLFFLRVTCLFGSDTDRHWQEIKHFQCFRLNEPNDGGMCALRGELKMSVQHVKEQTARVEKVSPLAS